jgi:hypothetical protein
VGSGTLRRLLKLLDRVRVWLLAGAGGGGWAGAATVPVSVDAGTMFCGA